MSSFESVTFDRYLDDRKALIETALGDALSSSDANSKAFVDSMRYPLLAGGKRLRPILCLACCEMFGGDVRAALPTAVAIEMIHTMSLIHDDLPAMGNHSTRRGKPTIHTAFGEDIAILSGDALLAKAFEIIVQDSTLIGADKVLQILGRLGAASGAMGLAGNQAKELAAQKLSSGGDVTIESMEVQKTIALIKVSVALGAFVAGATASDIAILEQYAENIGIAFHLTDQIIAAGSSEEVQGEEEEVEKKRVDAVRHAAAAKECVEVFGSRSQPLLMLADFVIHRVS